jgi:ribokinase
MVDRDGQNQIAVASGANLAVAADGVDELFANRSGVLLTNFEIPDAPLVAAAKAALAQGWQVVVNPAPARPLPEELRGAGAIVTPNEHELAGLTGIEEPERAARALAHELGGGTVAVTLGAAGALLVTEDETHWVAAPSVAARDSTGAGDVFNGVLAAALAEGACAVDAVDVAVAAASYAVELPGARGQLSRAELEERRARAARA